MTQLSTNLRTHICYIKEWNDERELHITKTQYDIIREDVENLKMNDFYKITDIDNWKILFDWQRKYILRFKEKDLSNSTYIAICELWERHNMINWQIECDCLNKMNIDKMDIIPWLSLLWYKINNYSDITKEMRQKLYIEARKSDFKERVEKEFLKIKQD